MKPRKTKSVLAWYFFDAKVGLHYGDGRRPKKGVTHTVNGKIELCKWGLHASKNPLDALRYAPGTQVAFVELSGRMKHGDDKLVASKRKYLFIADAEKTLHLFACRVAKDALDAEKRAGRIPDIRSYRAIEAKHKYVNGEIGYDELSDAEIAAESAAWRVAESAEWSIARVAAEGAAHSAARSAADSAVYSAARSVSWIAHSVAEIAAENAVYKRHNHILETAESVASSAIYKRYNRILTQMLMKLAPKGFNKKKGK